jgi:uncharacterized membrane protein
MSTTNFLSPPMFPNPADIYVPLAEFSADTEPAQKSEMDQAIAALNRKAADFSSSKGFTKDYLDFINHAETCVKHKQWNEAHKTVWAATFLINRALESKAAAKFRKCMGLYYAGWVLFLVAVGCWLKLLETGTPHFFFGSGYWRYVMMGGLGGITVAIWGLSLHTVNLDFDRSFSVWYWLKPLLGGIMGLIVVITVQAGMLAVEGHAALPTTMSGKWTLYVLAFLAGFSERFFIGIIDRVMSALLNSGQTASPASATLSTPPPPKTPAQ